jgi:hypothetical protein
MTYILATTRIRPSASEEKAGIGYLYLITL